MTEPMDDELLALAVPYALHAVNDRERVDIEQRVAAAVPSVAAAFREEVRAARETMAVASTATALEPPPELRDRLLAAIEPPSPKWNRWRTTVLAVAAAAVVAAVAFGAGLSLRPEQPKSVAEQVITASDVQTTSSRVTTGGTATVVYSRAKNTAVLLLSDVSPPTPGTVYQMWFLGGAKPISAGTLNAAGFGPTTTDIVPDLGHANALAFTVEPGTGSEQPTGPIFAQLPLR
ncbi:anti-sigma-K factor RskA [Mycobacterium sp. MAA66]|uniref:anti-sigma factor n=1 Tax=Mycobacterium sp. MAA66 TaxID=3156297 RepID=UPI003518FFEC